MITDDIHSLSGAYAVDAVDDDERASFEAHLADCSACQAEVASLRAAAGELALGTTATPPASLRESVLRNISSVRPLPPVVDAPESVARPKSANAHHSPMSVDPPESANAPQPPTSVDTPPPPASLDTKRTERAVRTERARRNPARWLASVAAAAAILTGGALWHPWSPAQEQAQLTATQQVLTAKDAQHFTKQIGAATATVVRSNSLGKAIIVTANMPAPPKGKVYELWLLQGTTMVKAGFMPNGASNTVLLNGDAASALGAGITIEPPGGSPAPSAPPVALIAFA